MQDKEKLRSFLELIQEIINKEGNEWFHDELALLVNKKLLSEKDRGIKLSAVTVKESGSINKYIENGIIPIIDYSEIDEDNIRLQLEKDCFEMGKIRLGKTEKDYSFLEVCKFAHFQIEALVNYFYRKISSNSIEKAKEMIDNYNSNFKDYGYESIESIPVLSKFFALKEQLQIKNQNFNVLRNIANVRNDIIHRNIENYIDFEKLKNEFSEINNKPPNSRTNKDKEILKDYYKEKFKREEKFTLIMETLGSFKEKIITYIN
ncbi:MAG: hypothetical protein BRD49_05960 [Bacteroidetes bacterium SW_10_40_5]|nr:MAG: hypothetical protein BRD49_05960 [Bacteroidetes bacterium SW_10_40_5]